MQRYSFVSLLRNALAFHEGWERAWRAPPLKDSYDVVIVGAGGHGLATAYYLAKEHGITDIAVLERGWLGGGNTARNTSTIRSNYLRDISIKFNDASVKLYETLSQELNFNIMFSQRSQVDIVQTWSKWRDLRRRSLAMDLHGAEYRFLTVPELQARVPALGDLTQLRLPVIGGVVQEAAGIARHDAIAWGYARGADARGVEIHQHTEVTGFERGADGAVTAVETTRGKVRARKVALAGAGNSSHVARLAGLNLPLQTRNLQAWVSDPMKPVLDVVANCPDVGVYVIQTDKGELLIGGGTDPVPSYRQGTHVQVFEDAVAAMLELFPRFRNVKLLRQWGGHIEFSYDASPIISTTPISGLFVSCGWWGGFKAIPIGGRTFAHTIATGTPHPLSAGYALDRFSGLRFVLEAGTVAQR